MLEGERFTGRDLRLLRVYAGVRQTEVARAWGCSRGNVARVEQSQRPTPAAIGRYLDAVKRALAADDR